MALELVREYFIEANVDPSFYKLLQDVLDILVGMFIKCYDEIDIASNRRRILARLHRKL